MATDLAKHEITRLLLAGNEGDETAFAQLVEAELRLLARHCLKNERYGHTRQSLELVNEAYLRLIDWENVQWQNRAHFFSLAAQIMRRILVDYVRRRHRTKHGGGELHISLTEAAQEPQPFIPDVIALNDALEALAKFAPRQARLWNYVSLAV